MPTDTADFPVEVRAFDPSCHERDGFDCGVERLNNFLHLTAKKQTKDNLTRVYVLLEAGKSRVLGYHAINVFSLTADDLGVLKPKATAKHGMVPALYLSMVATDLTVQGNGFGGLLLMHAFAKAVAVSDQAGCWGIVLDVLADGGAEVQKRRADLYCRFGFRPFPSNADRMFIPIAEVRAALAAADAEITAG